MEATDHPLQLFNTSGLDLPFKESEAAFLLDAISDDQGVSFAFVEVVFVDEHEIVRINKEFLERDYVTDIISFRYDEDASNKEIEGTLYCCAPRISEQASEFNQPVEREFLRVLIHGLLHLCGYEDDTPDKKKEMTRLEDHFLSLIQ